MGLKPRLSSEDIERFRQSTLRIDRQGEIWHEGKTVTHQRLREALLSWLDVLPDGRNIIRLDEKRYTYVQVDDSHLLARSLYWDSTGRAICKLNSGETKTLIPSTLHIGNGHAMYGTIGKLTVRLTTAAYYVLAERIIEKDDHFWLDTGSSQHRIDLN